MSASYTVKFEEIGRFWVATSRDIIGLFVCSPTLEQAMEEVAATAPTLMKMNGQKPR